MRSFDKCRLRDEPLQTESPNDIQSVALKSYNIQATSNGSDQTASIVGNLTSRLKYLYHVCPPVRKIIHSLKLVAYLHIQADNPWYNFSMPP